MAVKRKPNRSIANKKIPIEHTGFYPYILKYHEAMQVINYSKVTLRRRDGDLRRFAQWCEERGIDAPQEVTKPVLDRYATMLYHYRQPNGKPLSSGSRVHYITSIKQFFKWLTQQNFLLYNPASEMPLPKQGTKLPMVLSVDEVENLMREPLLSDISGLRDRAILELLYSTGIRRMEACNIELSDICLSRLSLHVKAGKNDKDRVIPIGERAAYWIGRYVGDIRKHLLLDIAEERLFIDDYGLPFSVNRMSDMVTKYMRKAKILKGSCHLLRHAMATHMLENGAELRFIQAMLGHTDCRTTQVYTHVSIKKLQEIHAATHPAKIHEDK